MINRSIMPDATVDKLRAKIAIAKKPDSIRRWAGQLIERMLVAERAALILLRTETGAARRPLHIEAELWHDAQFAAIRELRKEGKVR